MISIYLSPEIISLSLKRLWVFSQDCQDDNKTSERRVNVYEAVD